MDDVEHSDAVTDDAHAGDDDATRVSIGASSPTERSRGRALLKDRLLGVAGGAAQIGRFAVLKVLGEGGMGVVFSAYDEELDRRVAIKVMGSDNSGDATERAYMQREAQALAKLSHPNVVQVYDVGTYEGRLYLAMEYIQGMTLRDWLREKRPWREVLAMLIAAGRGLAAAHEAGLVHRDFKPQNVIVGDDGRPRVLDFGLAKRGQDEERAGPQPSGAELATSTLERELTEAGTLLGTPAYMSPEQHRAGTTTARSDQFSFCVTLYEGLYGQRPFKARSLGEYAKRVHAGAIESPPSGVSVPLWLRRVVVRGLSPKEEERWSSMDALLVALERDPGRALRRGAVIAAAAVVLAGGTYALARHQTEQDLAEADTCKGAAARLASVWDDERRAAVEQAFRDTGVSYGEDVAARVVERLDARAEQWVSLHEDACQTHRRGEISAELLDLRMACLDERRREMAALTEVFVEADSTVIKNGVQATSSLKTLTPCADSAYLRAAVPPPTDPAVAASVGEAREQLAVGRAMIVAGKYAEGAALAKTVTEQAEPLGYAPLVVEARFQLGFGRLQSGESEEAREDFMWVHHKAVALGMDEIAALSAAHLVFLLGARMVRVEEARRWVPHAESFVARVGENSLAGGILDNGLGGLAMRTSDPALGEMHFRRSAERFARAEGVGEYQVGNMHANLAAVLSMQQKWDEAVSHSEKALEIFTRALGPSHPANMHPLANWGNALKVQGQYEEALTLYRRALEVNERALGPDDVNNSMVLNNIGAALRRLEDYDGAREAFERALAIREKTMGPEHPLVANVQSNLADISVLARDYKKARELYTTTLEVREKVHGEDHPLLLLPLAGLARVELGEGNTRRAISLLERALALYDPERSNRNEVGEVRFQLARLLRGSDQRARAVQLAQAAAEDFESYGSGFTEELAEVRAWLAERTE